MSEDAGKRRRGWWIVAGIIAIGVAAGGAFAYRELRAPYAEIQRDGGPVGTRPFALGCESWPVLSNGFGQFDGRFVARIFLVQRESLPRWNGEWPARKRGFMVQDMEEGRGIITADFDAGYALFLFPRGASDEVIIQDALEFLEAHPGRPDDDHP